ncbi:acyltransferase family protein [Lysobacter humi (ex Lee et al. 2017)]
MSAHATIDRIHGLDALRAGALLLGVVLHACMSYMPGASQFWLVSDPAQSVVASGAFFWIHSFRMLVFFVLAGYFGRQLVERRGPLGFVRNRARRVLVPLLAAWPPVFAAIIAVMIWNAWLRNGGHLPASPPPGPRFTADSFPLTHLWFLHVLVLFYVAALVGRSASGRWVAPALMQRLRRAAGAVGTHALGRWLVALPMAIGLLMLPEWMPWFGVPTPDRSLYPNVAAVLAYGSAFAYGWLLQSVADGMAAHRTSWRSALGVAMIASVACLAWVGASPSADPAVAGGATRTAAFATLYAVSGWAWVFALVGLLLAFADRPAGWRRYLSDASFWIYVAHLPVIAAGQVLLSRVHAPFAVELPLLLASASVVLLASYQLLIRGTWLGRMLGFSPYRGRTPVVDGAAAVTRRGAPHRGTTG